jgi:hypothetical protein
MNTDATVGRPALRPPTRPAHFGPPDALRTVWTRTRATVRWMLDHGDRDLFILGYLGAATAKVLFTALLAQDAIGFSAVADGPRVGLEFAVRLTVLFGAAVLFFAGGRLAGGVGTLRETFVAFGWGLMPLGAALPFAALGLLAQHSGRPGGLWIAGSFVLVAWLWSAATVVLATAEAQRLPAARALIVALVVWAALYLGGSSLGIRLGPP